MKCGIPAPDFFKKLIENVEWGQFLEILVQEKKLHVIIWKCQFYFKSKIKHTI